MTAKDWQRALGALLNAVPPDEDRFVLALLTQQDADGDLFKYHLPDDALHHMNNEYLDYWWANTGTAQSSGWIDHRWRVLRTDPATMTVVFARISSEQQGQGQ